VNDYFLDVEYRKGYFKALMDVNNFLDTHSNVMKHYRLNNSKNLKMLFKAMLEGQDALMKYGEHADIHVTWDKNDPRKVISMSIKPMK
jgi:hypothetical protein